MNDTDSPADDETRDAVGYARPPRSTQYCKGQSGNPKGRPKGRKSEIPHDTLLGRMVTVREDGRERRVTAAEAFILHITRKGLAGDSAAARASLAAIENARSRRPGNDEQVVFRICYAGVGTCQSIETLGIGIKKYRGDEHRVRVELNPWIVESALERLGERRLTEAEQREVWANTRTPHKVAWPSWWSVKG